MASRTNLPLFVREAIRPPLAPFLAQLFASRRDLGELGYRLLVIVPLDEVTQHLAADHVRSGDAGKHVERDQGIPDLGFVVGKFAGVMCDLQELLRLS